MDAAVDPSLQVGELTVDERDVALLEAVARTGSLHAASDELGRSYSRAHERITQLEAELGALVERTRGGADGGGSELTPAARELLARFERIATLVADAAATERATLAGEVRDRDGRLVTVETSVGRMLALADDSPDGEPRRPVDEADRVQVTVPADAVTLEPTEARPENAGGEAIGHGEVPTSARNRFEGTVSTVERETATALVTVVVSEQAEFVVRVTTESLEELDLEAGSRVFVRFKATATRATPAP